ncbi:hypothetical protein C9928_05650 [Pseudidiomarina aestuarii]|uniref:Uncharacterized protein n=1 Tax=Pseudidiomarina aestuarii TaxID=624146 RepID=A0A2T4D4L6_9GAMM|nr:hypothetical protein C9988_03220 [Pseudidiomarina aestuarii]PTB88753.1 hypothetical protein C9928_05650 [Pseudidiomarina aestuarii]
MEVRLIKSFKSAALELYFRHADASNLPFCSTALAEVSEILIDLNLPDFDIADLRLLWTVNEYSDFTSVTVTVNRTEPTGAILFNYYQSQVYEVDYFCEGYSHDSNHD